MVTKLDKDKVDEETDENLDKFTDFEPSGCIDSSTHVKETGV